MAEVNELRGASTNCARRTPLQFFAFHVHPGHEKEWREVVKMVKDAHERARDGAHWGMYRLMFGGEGGTYVALSGDPSMPAIDDGFTGHKKYHLAPSSQRPKDANSPHTGTDFQCFSVGNDQCRTSRFQEFLEPEVTEDAGNCLAGGADVLADLSVRERAE